MLYFTPETKKGNGVGVFNAYEKSKKDPEVHALVNYLINWVAGTKIIFIALLGVMLAVGNEDSLLLGTFVLILSILTFFWRLYPIMKKMDEADQISPKGYSKTLAVMIWGFITFLSIALIYTQMES
jgi:cytochrome bd-type quinol oxidase subunit 2